MTSTESNRRKCQCKILLYLFAGIVKDTHILPGFCQKTISRDEIIYPRPNLPNKEERLLSPPLLRTVRASFPSYGSSAPKPLSGGIICLCNSSLQPINTLCVCKHLA